MKKHWHLFESSVPIFKGKLIVIFTNDLKKLRKAIPSFPHNYIFGNSAMGEWQGAQAYFIIFNFWYKGSPINPELVTHEAVHITNFIASHCGFKPDFENDEPTAYLAGYIAGKVFEAAAEAGFMKVKLCK